MQTPSSFAGRPEQRTFVHSDAHGKAFILPPLSDIEVYVSFHCLPDSKSQRQQATAYFGKTPKRRRRRMRAHIAPAFAIPTRSSWRMRRCVFGCSPSSCEGGGDLNWERGAPQLLQFKIERFQTGFNFWFGTNSF